MALTRAKKTQKVEILAKELAGSTSAIVGTFAKLTVSQDFVLRQKVREAGGHYRVLKNKLAARASQGTGIEGALQGLKGVSSVAYTSGDPVALAKALSAWVKDNAEFTFKLGIVDGKVITVEEVQSLATMPGKNEIFAKLLYLLSAPAQRLVTVISATSRDLAVVINQGVEKGKFLEGNSAGVSTVEASSVAEEAPAGEAQSVATATQAPAVEAYVTEEAQALIEKPALLDSLETAVQAADSVSDGDAEQASEAKSEFAEAPAPAEGPAAEGSEAESQPTQAEEAAGELPAEG